ncbi:MAG: hypothetical protein ACR2NP_03815 [Pirellulaceae bacterium]
MSDANPSEQDHHQFRRRFSFSVSEWSVALFTALYMLIALVSALALGNPEFVYYIVVMLVLIAGVLWMHSKVQLPMAALWALSVWGLAHMAGGLMPIPQSWPSSGNGNVLYNLWLLPGALKYDQLVHMYGFGIVTWICWVALSRTADTHSDLGQPKTGLLVLCVAAGMGFGALNEVVEFFATLLMPETNVGGYQNTGWDLVANMAGCVIAAIVICVVDRDSPAIGESQTTADHQ